MCNLSQGVWEKAFQQGYEIGYEIGYKIGEFKQGYYDLCNLLEATDYTIEKAMSILKVPEKDQQVYMGLLEQKMNPDDLIAPMLSALASI